MMFYRYLVFVIFAMSFSTSVQAFIFTPTEQEFYRWPHYCQAMYAGTQVAQRNGFWKKVPKAEADKWFPIGSKNGGAWHYCAGLTKLQRANVALTASDRKHYYTSAIGDAKFCIDRTAIDNPWAALYLGLMGRAYRGLRDYDNAMKVLELLRSKHPKNVDGYTITGLVYRDMKKFGKAKEILLKADEVANHKSSEVIYFLGMVSLDMGDIDGAKKYAKKASEMGYPFSGLKDKITKLEQK